MSGAFEISVEAGHECAALPRPLIFRLRCACGREAEARGCLLAFRSWAARAGWRIRESAATCPACVGKAPEQMGLFG